MFRTRIIPLAFTVVITLTCVVIAQAPAQPKLDELRKQLDTIANGFQFKLGYSLHHLKKNERLDRLGDELFPTDSTLKVAIMCAAMEKVERGEINYYNVRPLLKEDRNAGGFFYSYREGTEVEFKEALHQMIAVSDNTATLMLMRWTGGTEVVNQWLDQHGLKTTRLLTHHPLSDVWKRDEAETSKIIESIKQWGMGVTTPNEMRRLMEMILEGKAGTAAASDEMHRILNHQYHDQGIAGQIPPWVVVASKSGRSPNSQSDMAIVHSPSGTYVLTIFTKDSKDTRGGWQNERSRAIRAISRAVWQYYHSDEKWSPPAGVEKY
jgi:beta-lactamase class A